VTKTLKTPDEVRAFARSEYAKEYRAASDAERAEWLSPAKAYGKAKELGYASPESIVALVYLAENGKRNPLPGISPESTPAKIAEALRKRRKENRRVSRIESLVASASAALGRPISRREIDALLYDGKGRGKLARETDYVGRGTRARATATRTDALAEVEGDAA
jgi:hypothetical protein